MISKINPSEIIVSHFKTFRRDRGNKFDWVSVVFQIALAVILASVHVLYFKVSDDVVSIVVSVASIIAGLLLNLMVLIYTLVTGRLRISRSNIAILEEIGNETIANIAFCILASIVLVIAALLNLTDNCYINIIGHYLMIFFGVLVTLTMLIVLVNFYTLINNSVK